MGKQIALLVLLLTCSVVSQANMASPIVEGTLAASGISSKDIDISSEKINIRINAAFSSAVFNVEYTINTATAGKQIPLLFYAVDYQDSFRVWVDDEVVSILPVPEQFFARTKFESFANTFRNGSAGDEITITWRQNSNFICRLKDLKYFETPLSKGIHRIRVQYTAKAWEDRSDWIKTYSFRYSLSPARFWKSFGSLDVSVQQDGDPQSIKTNLGLPGEKQTSSVNTWHFNHLPAEFIEISFQPKPNKLAAALIYIDPAGLAVCAGILLLFLHIFFLAMYRRNHIARKFSPVVIIGSIVVPLLMLIVYMYAYIWIDEIIGEHAARRHGYTFLVLLLYPFIVVAYWLACWIIDRFYKRKLLQSNVGAGVDG